MCKIVHIFVVEYLIFTDVNGYHYSCYTDIPCSVAPTVNHSTAYVEDNAVTGIKMVFVCETGYRFPGNLLTLSIECSNDGRWSDPNPPPCLR